MKQKYALSKAISLGVLCGGKSRERKISIRSGRAIQKALKKIGFRASLMDPSQPGFKKKLSEIDLAFIALHGEGGEDGAIQRLLAKRNLPYTGSGVRGCLNSFDKIKSKRLFVKNRIPTPAFKMIKYSRGWQKRLKNQKTPFFIKPSAEGSSIGTFCIEDFDKNVDKIRAELIRYKVLLIEEKIEGREYTVGVLGEKALPVVELRPKRSFYDYKAKYTKGMTNYLAPAPITRKMSLKLQRLALKVHRVLGLRDMSRVDILVDRAGRPSVLEANSIPGFTEFSLLPKAAKVAGISFQDLCYRLVQLAHSR